MKHKEKVKLANKMTRSKSDIEKKRGIFDTDAWELRRQGIAKRVKRQQDAAHARAVARKEKLINSKQYGKETA